MSEAARPGRSFIGAMPARLIVFGSSAAVLVMEIAAGRLLAPFVGVSLETFTGIIGVILAGIATGAALGGRMADRHDPTSLLGASLGLGGLTTWLSVPIVEALGPSVGDDVIGIVSLSTFGFFVPAVILSAASPIVAKLRLADLDDTGSVVGGLSAAGTIGALAGTFLTGFVFVALVGTRTILFVVGGALVVAGVGVHVWLRRSAPPLPSALLVLAAALPGFAFDASCDVETKYACAVVEVDPADPSVVSLYLDTLHHARVDLDDPTNLEFRYVRIFGDVATTFTPGPIDGLHIGGGGFTFPRQINAVRPGSTQHVLEIDPGVVDIARDHLGLVLDVDLTVDIGDARTALDELPTNGYDLVVGDAFSGRSVPWHLTTIEVARAIDRLLRPGGIYTLNVIDGGESAFARAELATLRSVFEHVAVVAPPGFPSVASRNLILVASDRPLPSLEITPADGFVLDGPELDEFIGGADVLTDDHAPVDQLLPR